MSPDEIAFKKVQSSCSDMLQDVTNFDISNVTINTHKVSDEQHLTIV